MNMIQLMIATEPLQGLGLSGINWNTIILGILSIVGTGVTGVVAIYVAKANQSAIAAKEAVRDVKSDLAVSTEQSHVAQGQTDNKLNIIHALSNSALTASMKSDENAQTLNILMMEEMLDFKNSQGSHPSEEALSTLTKAKGRVEELRRAIAEREKQQAVINSKIAESKEGPTQVIVVNTDEKPVIVDPVKNPPPI